VRVGVAGEEAAGLHSIGRWVVAGKPQRKDYLTRTIATIPNKVSIYLKTKPLILKIKGFFVLSHRDANNSLFNWW